MVNDILSAITKQLGLTFGNSYKYYVENVKQNLTKPCFTVDILEARERSKSKVLYDRTMPIVIHFFTDNEETIKTDCYDMAERIKECIEYLPFNGTTLRGDNVRWVMVEDVLELFITYRFTTRTVVDETIMYDLVHPKISAKS